MHSESTVSDDDDDVSKLRRQWQGLIIYTFRRRPPFRLSSTTLNLKERIQGLLSKFYKVV